MCGFQSVCIKSAQAVMLDKEVFQPGLIGLCEYGWKIDHTLTRQAHDAKFVLVLNMAKADPARMLIKQGANILTRFHSPEQIEL